MRKIAVILFIGVAFLLSGCLKIGSPIMVGFGPAYHPSIPATPPTQFLYDSHGKYAGMVVNHQMYDARGHYMGIIH